MSHIQLPYKFEPREYQRELLHAIFIEKKRHVYWIVHRRAGKTKTAINILTIAACREVGTFIILLPQTNQARRVIWDGMDGQGMKMIDHIPKEIIAKTNSTDMTIRLINGSIMQLGGSNNYDALMGTNPRMIISDEYPLHDPMARQYLSPILLENGGTEILLGTPRGSNHGLETYELALHNPDWYVRKLTIDDTKKKDGSPVITREQIEQEILNGASEEIIQQEFYVSFSVGNVGAYYTEEMDQANYEGRITDFTINRGLPIFASWDLGVRDATAICFFQKNGDHIDYIDYLESTGKGIDYYAAEVFAMEKKYNQRVTIHWGPHDLAQREWGNSAKTRIMTAREYGIYFNIVPNVSIQDRINAGRAHLKTCRFHKTNCKQLITVLKEYMRDYDDVKRIFSDKPLHNWASHGADSFTYSAVAFRDAFVRPDQNQPFQIVRNF